MVEIWGIGRPDYDSVSTLAVESIVTPTASSGGTAIGSGAVSQVIIKNMSGNADVWIGSSGAAKAPYSGFGFSLADQEAITVNVNNINVIRVCANVSGEAVTVIGR